MIALDKRNQRIQIMFSSIARRYDLMNAIMTFGQDARWRREVIRRAKLSPGSHLLDLGTGTGDLAREALIQQPACTVTAADYTLAMMQVGNKRGRLDWSAADALHLPFPNESFHTIVSGFLLRNVFDVPLSLREQFRTLKPGGRIIILDTTQPSKNMLYPLIWIHLHWVIPVIGRLFSRQPDAYNYLIESTDTFLKAEQLADAMQEAGFRQVGFQRKMFGTIAIHWGQK